MSNSASVPLAQNQLSATDLSILRVLLDYPGRVASRESILRLSGLSDLSSRRVDSSLVALRRVLGSDSIITVRRRGWMLSDDALTVAAKLLAHKI